ncbi:hypothetical protein MCY_00705 [Bartonella rattimassiliensis 15908]|uniref:Uncharacterized protein n=1 Tax=Bartonella rattimassiliensis 15908 TaxID=1094556 RepID=J0QLU8_9HYPH|nr:hypothetical protein MCY_00705 [Bartonella rattimassiliensis 15908]
MVVREYYCIFTMMMFKRAQFIMAVMESNHMWYVLELKTMVLELKTPCICDKDHFHF